MSFVPLSGCLDRFSNLYVINYSRNTVEKYNKSDLTFISNFCTGKFRNPSNSSVDGFPVVISKTAATATTIASEILATGNGILTSFSKNLANTSIENNDSLSISTTVFIPVASESVGTGDNTEVTFTKTLAHTPVRNNASIIITAGDVTGTDATTGTIVGTGITAGTINYTTGELSVTFDTAPALDAAITVAYQYTATITGNDTATAGTIAGTGVTGTINYQSGAISLTFTNKPIDDIVIAYKYFADRILVSNTWSNCVIEYDLNGLIKRTYTNATMCKPNGLAIDELDQLHVTTLGTSEIFVFNMSTGALVKKYAGYGTGNGKLRHPHGIHITAAGDIYVADTDNNRIVKFTKTTHAYETKYNLTPKCDGPLNVVLNSDVTRSFITRRYSTAIYMASEVFANPSTITHTCERPKAVLIDSSTLFVFDVDNTGNGKIEKVSLA